MNDFKLWKFIAGSLAQKKKTAIAIVTDSSDSSPGRQGFKMAYTEDGQQFGTVGGGMLEIKMIKIIKEGFANNKRSVVNILHHDPNSGAEKSGLICGGVQTIVTYFLDNSDKDLADKILESFENARESILSVSQNGIQFLPKSYWNERISFRIKNINDYEYRELYGLTDTVYIIGGGHVGLAVAKVMSMLDFYVVTIDNRPEVFTMEQNVYSDKKIICNFKDAGKHVREGMLSYVVIVTPMHKSDKEALSSVINKNVKYIGMMGSKRKIETVFSNLVGEGISPALLKKVHTPIGLEIEAKTPEEIAISIAAEIISVKNNSTSNTDKL